MEHPPNPIGRLLRELSWEGNARRYRKGGRGRENVLTTEVFQALDFLPRAAFLGRIIRSAEGGDATAVASLADQVEEATISLLPGNIVLSEPGAAGKAAAPLQVQPDGIIETTDVYCLLEAKRLRPGSFQPEQLARELLAVLQETGDRHPLLLLVLPEPPPIPVKHHGRLSLHDAVARFLAPALERADFGYPPFDEIIARIDQIICHTTWARISEAVQAGVRDFEGSDHSVRGSVARLAEAVTAAIRWHA